MNYEKPSAHIVRAARSWLGTPYQHQASLQHVGCDCLGLVRGIWRAVEGAEPEAAPIYSSAWSEVSGKEQLISAGHRHFLPINVVEMQPGDILVFRLRPRSAAKHLGILSDNDHFIHAYDGSAVVETALVAFWKDRIAAVFRFPSASNESA